MYKYMYMYRYTWLYIVFSIFTETRNAFSKLLSLTMEPKSVEIRKGSQKVITDLFNLNTAGFSLMLRSVPRNLQVWNTCTVLVLITCMYCLQVSVYTVEPLYNEHY